MTMREKLNFEEKNAKTKQFDMKNSAFQFNIMFYSPKKIEHNVFFVLLTTYPLKHSKIPPSPFLLPTLFQNTQNTSTLSKIPS